jgi:transketolase
MDTSLEQKARAIRATVIRMAHDGRQGHLKGSLSCVDILVALYNGWLRADPSEPKHPDRDRFILSKGHGCTALYAALADRGYMPKEWLGQYARSGSPLPNHACRHALPLLECSAGSLGHGLGIATGMLYGLRMAGRTAPRAVVLMSDGECNEGSVWEAATFAAAHGLENLLAIVDYNGLQAVGRSEDLMGHMPMADKFRAFGWGVRTVDGNRIADIQAALDAFPFEKGRPSALVAKTRAGAGVSFMEDDIVWHYRVPDAEDVKKALAELGEAPIHLRETP